MVGGQLPFRMPVRRVRVFKDAMTTNAHHDATMENIRSIWGRTCSRHRRHANHAAVAARSTCTRIVNRQWGSLTWSSTWHRACMNYSVSKSAAHAVSRFCIRLRGEGSSQHRLPGPAGNSSEQLLRDRDWAGGARQTVTPRALADKHVR
jgi:hypothetical protein